MIYTGVAGIYQYSPSRDIIKITKTLIRNLSHRGTSIVASCKDEAHVDTEEFTEYGAPILVQFGFDIDIGSFRQTNTSSDRIIVMDGRIYNMSPLKVDKAKIREASGYFSIAIYDKKKNRLEVYRDFLGRRPLFYGYNSKVFVFASEAKGFREFMKPKRLPPGSMIIIEEDGFSVEEYYEFESLLEAPSITDFSKCVSLLEDMLRTSVGRSMEDGSPAIMFSGGLDSSTLAHIAHEFSDVELFSIAIPESRDYIWAKRAAELLGMRLNLRIVKEEEIEEYIYKTIRATEEKDPLKIMIGTPIYIVCEFIHDSGYKIALAGQGADELFGGYAKYLRMTKEELSKALIEDVRSLAEKNLERDDNVAMANSVDLRTPYLSDEIIKLALRMPIEFKVRNGIRKYILRRVAMKMGVPREIVNMEKKAIQYSTGIAKHIGKIAKKRKMSIAEYVSKIYAEIWGED